MIQVSIQILVVRVFSRILSWEVVKVDRILSLVIHSLVVVISQIINCFKEVIQNLIMGVNRILIRGVIQILIVEVIQILVKMVIQILIVELNQILIMVKLN